MRKILVSLICIILFICTSCRSSEKIVGKWSYVCSTTNGIDATQIELLFNNDSQFVIARNGQETNGTWKKVPTTDEGRNKYEISFNGYSDYVYLDKKSHVLFMNDTLLFAQNESQKKAAMNYAYQELCEKAKTEEAIKLAEALNKPQSEIENLKNERLQQLKNTDIKAAIEIAEELGVSEEEITSMKYELLSEYIHTEDFDKALILGKELDPTLPSVIAEYERGLYKESQNIKDAIEIYSAINLPEAKERVKELSPYAELIGVYNVAETISGLKPVNIWRVYIENNKVNLEAMTEGNTNHIFCGEVGKKLKEIGNDEEDSLLVTRNGDVTYYRDSRYMKGEYHFYK